MPMVPDAVITPPERPVPAVMEVTVPGLLVSSWQARPPPDILMILPLAQPAPATEILSKVTAEAPRPALTTAPAAMAELVTAPAASWALPTPPAAMPIVPEEVMTPPERPVPAV